VRKIRVAIVTSLVVALLGVLLWTVSNTGEREPVYQGKTLTCWLSDFWPGRKATREKLEQNRFAVRQIGTNAIPILLRWISAEDGPFKQKIVTWISDHPRFPFRLESSVDKNMLALSGFSILGKSQASAAIPALVEIVKTGGGERSGPNDVTFAMMALADVDRETAVKAGIEFGTNRWSGTNITVIGWSAPSADVKK